MEIVQMKNVREFLPHAVAMYDIWPQYLANTMLEATIESMTKPEVGVDLTLPYFITDGDEVVGITGFFMEPTEPYHVYLRWTGLLSNARGKGHFREILRQVCVEILQVKPEAKLLVEMMPVNEYGAKLAVLFRAMGFITMDKPVECDWSTFKWQRYVLNMDTFLNWVRPDASDTYL